MTLPTDANSIPKPLRLRFTKPAQPSGQKEQGNQCDDHSPHLKRKRSAAPLCQESGLHTAKLPHAASGYAVDSHHPPLAPVPAIGNEPAQQKKLRSITVRSKLNNPRYKGEFVSSKSSHPCATLCIHEPTLETK